jgi:HD superfamily phosphodiesterase
MNNNEILKSIGDYVANYIHQYKDQSLLPYHDLQHTIKVVEAAKQIAGHYQLNEHDFSVVVVAAWFHDLGYYAADARAHEAKGAELAALFLTERGADNNMIAEVSGCILATQLPQRPSTLLEKIVCDADLFHLGTDDFAERNKLMRKECELATHQQIDKQDWRADTIKLFQSHEYHTDYCRLLLNEKKQQNLDKLIKKEKNSAQETMNLTKANSIDKAEENSKAEKPTRGIETMFRVASSNHQRLSDMADSKANIMISVNAIIISVVIGFVGRRLDSTQAMLIPTLLLLIGCVTAIIFAVLATRPKIPDGFFTQQQVADKTVNLLFFGNFYKMDYEHYYDGMKKVMADREFLYGSLIKDIHSQGKVLGSKYKQLRISYTVFMFTLIISVVAFAFTFIFLDK